MEKNSIRGKSQRKNAIGVIRKYGHVRKEERESELERILKVD